MDSFRKAHSLTSLKRRLPKVSSTNGAAMRLKLKKLLYDFSNNDLDSIRKETIKEYTDETLNDSTLDGVQDVDDLSNIDYAFGQAEDEGVDLQQNILPKTDKDEDVDNNHVDSAAISHFFSSVKTGKYVTKLQSNNGSVTKDKPSKRRQKTTNISNEEVSDTSNNESIVSSEDIAYLDEQSLFDISGGLASAIKENIAKNVSADHSLSSSDSPTTFNPRINSQNNPEELDSSNEESLVSSEEIEDLDEQSLFDISGGLSSAIKKNIASSQKLDDQTNNFSDDGSSSWSNFPTNNKFPVDSRINPEFLDTQDSSFDCSDSDNSACSDIFTTMVCNANENTNNIKEIFSNYVCRIGQNELNCNQYIPANVTNMFKVKENISKKFQVFIPTFDVPFEALSCEEQPDTPNRAVTVKSELDDTVAESSCTDFNDTLATRNLDDTVAESCCSNLDVTVATYSTATPQDHRQQTDSVEKTDAESDIMKNGGEQYHNDVRMHITKSGCVVVIKYPSCMYIEGKVIVRSLCGHVEIFGYKLNENPVNVFSPRYNYSMPLKTFPNEGDAYGLFGKLTHLGLSVAKTEDIVTSLSLHDAVLFMEPLKEPLCPFIETHWSLAVKTSDKAYSKQNPDLFSKSKSYYDEEFFEASQILVDCSLYANKPTKQLQKNPLWESLVRLGQEKNSVAVIAGGKNVGKSTLLRYYVNKLLPQGPVAVVDLDPGQSEFTIAGNISITVVKAPLLGPNFTHLQTPNIMLNLGLINVMDNFEKYTRAVHKIANHLQSNEEYHDIPWVINTMGFTATMGLKLIAYIILLLKPTVVAQLEAASNKHNFHINLSPSRITHVLNGFDSDELFNFLDLEEFKKNELKLDYEFIQIQHDVKKQYKFSLAKQQRYLNVLGYFSQVLHSSNNFLLNGAKPFFVSKANIKFGFNILVHEDMIFHVLNAKIVALCNDDNEEHELGKAFLMGDYAYVCYGHGIVRGVDIVRGLVYLITPVDSSVLHHVNALLYAEHMPELQLAKSELPGGAHVPYREPVASPRHARLMAAPRRRFNPMRLLRPKHLLRPPPQ